MTSFLDNLALVAMAVQAAGTDEIKIAKSAFELNASLARKFFSEQMFEISDSRMSRVVFLENMIEYDRHFRAIFALRQADKRVLKSVNLFTAFASDFLLHHELGHVVAGLDAFAPYVNQALQYAESLSEYGYWVPQQQRRFREEAAADIFGLTVVMKIYAELACERTIRAYCQFLIDALPRMEVLYLMAAQAHQRNVDPDYNVSNIDLRYEEWNCRRIVMTSYVAGISFSRDTVIPLTHDDFLDLPSNDDLSALTSTDFAAPISDASRQLAEAISLGFEGTGGFRAVVDATRVTRLVERRSI